MWRGSLHIHDKIQPMSCVLFVDDDVMTLQLMARATELVGHQAVVCETVEGGLKLTREQMPHLIFVDFCLQDNSGVRFIQELHRDPQIAHIPVILVSAGWPGDEDFDYSRDGGADGFILKPLQLDELERTIARFVDAKAS